MNVMKGASADWCPATWKHVHRYTDYGNWVEHNHPQCEMCGYIDTSRQLPQLKGKT